MVTQLSNSEAMILGVKSQQLWHDAGRYPTSLGCTGCPNRATCGGLNVGMKIFDCLQYCCGSPSTCDVVCRNNPQAFALRVREIGGFELQNVPRSLTLRTPELPTAVPVIFHGNKRVSAFAGSETVCLPMHKLIDARTGAVRFFSGRSLRERFKLHPSASVVLTGTATDQALERWWSFSSGRGAVIRALRELQISFVTTPNYSLFVDQPRWDDMYSMKRIAIVHQEFLDAGMPAALHLNARTERDWERWAQFIAARPEVTHVAFEFATGAGWGTRIEWHAQQLKNLRSVVARPLHLTVRGGIRILRQLRAAFDSVTYLDTSTFIKTVRRKAAFVLPSGEVRWRHAPTNRGELLDALLNQNWRTVSESSSISRGVSSVPQKAA